MKTIFKQVFNLLLLTTISFAVNAKVELIEGQVRAMPPSVPNTAAYLTLVNHGEHKRLVAVKTSVAKEAQLHTMSMDGGVMKMREVEGFDLPMHGTLSLEPSGNHIMILGLHKPLAIDQEIDLSLIFADGETMEIVLPVKKLKKGHSMSNHHGHEHHHHHGSH